MCSAQGHVRFAPESGTLSGASCMSVKTIRSATPRLFHVRSITLGLFVEKYDFLRLARGDLKHDRLAVQSADRLDGAGRIRLHVLARGGNLRARYSPRGGRASACIQGRFLRNAAAIG